MPQHSHWHYILGYLIVLIAHNWPVMLALALSAHAAWKLYRWPTRDHVRRLYGWMLLALAYEYAKHLGPELVRPVHFLLTGDWIWMVPGGVVLVELVPVPLLIAFALVLLLPTLGRRRAKAGSKFAPASEVHGDA